MQIRISQCNLGGIATTNNKNKSGNYVNKTFRLRADQLKRLEFDARGGNMSTNALIVSIIDRYLEWDKYSDIARFVSLPPNMVDGILANVTEKQMAAAGSYIADKSCFKDLSLHFFQAYNPTLFARLTTLFDRYANNYKVQADDSRNDGLHISFYHEFGRKWSLLVANLLHNELLRLGIKNHKFEVSENAVVFAFDDAGIPLPPEYVSRDDQGGRKAW
jgi:hypothetical protein